MIWDANNFFCVRLKNALNECICKFDFFRCFSVKSPAMRTVNDGCFDKSKKPQNADANAGISAVSMDDVKFARFLTLKYGRHHGDQVERSLCPAFECHGATLPRRWKVP